MKAIQLQSLVASTNELKVAELPGLQPVEDKYIIRIEASATNFFDILQVQGKHQQKAPLPFIAGNEYAGVVLATPTKPSRHAYKVGDKIFGAGLGAFATEIYANEESLRPLPRGWTALQASGLFYTAPTAYAALTERAHAKAGEYVLVHGAAGALGLAAIQVGKALGLHVIATANSPEKRLICKKYGADFVLDSETTWHEAARSITPNNRGVDVVLDPLGMVDKSLKCTAWNGRIVVIGFAAGTIEKIPMNRILLRNCSLTGLFWGMYATNEPETVTKVWNALLRLIDEGKIKPMIYTDKQFIGLESIPAALKLLATGEAWGKIAVSVPHEKTHRL